MPPLRVSLAATSLMLSVGACFATDSSTGTEGGTAEFAVQAALLASPADAGAAPINRIRAVATRVDDDLLLGQTVLDVSPSADSWTVVMSVRSAEGTAAVVAVYLIHVEGGVETVEFSGRSAPVQLVAGEVIAPEITLVRGPIDNLLVTGVTITSAPSQLVVGANASLSALVQTSQTANPTVFWTSLDPTVLTAQGSTVSAVALGVGRVVATAGLVSDTATIQVVEPGFGRVVGVVYDAVTSLVVASATVSIVGGNVSRTTSTAADGTYAFNTIPPGSYTVSALANGLQQNTALNLTVADGAGVRADFALPPLASGQRFGGLSGRVLDSFGSPLAGVAVAISGGAQTNGIFRSTTTGADGTYSLVGIVLDDTEGAPIQQFTVLATRSGLATGQTSIQLIQNRTVPNVNFQLVPTEGGTVFFEDAFEVVSSWTTQGFWNRSRLQGIRNAAVPTYVRLAPGDASNGALPAASEGAYAFWYGQASSGNFMGLQVPTDLEGSGGTSQLPNAGSLTSPVLHIPSTASTASLRFNTWFEIESVNPNESGFDLMTIGVLNVGTGVTTELGRLNPFVDPSLPERDAIPFTSGGFNAPPVWRTAYADLSAFAGVNIRLVFTFDTVDGLYNGFRGWIIDDVVVSDEPVPAGAPAAVSPPPDTSRSRTRR
jgi:hypothetical protein